VSNRAVNWTKLKEYIRWGIRFLDDVIEVNNFPLPQIQDMTLANRKIGLGVMGFADLLIRLGIPYNSKEAVTFAQSLMRFIRKESLHACAGLAAERGTFPNFSRSIYARKNLPLRNATVNTVAPTGTVSIIAGCSSGIEPLFAISFIRHVLSGTELFEVHPLFAQVAKNRGFYSKELVGRIAQSGSLQKIKGVPRDVQRIFVTAFDVTPRQHLEIQAAFQRYTDNSVSKTVNLPHEATVEDVKKIFLLAQKLRCKGITIYRYGSKEEQVLSFGHREKGHPLGSNDLLAVASEYAGGCASGSCLF